MKQMGSMRDQMATVAVWIRRWRGTCSGAKLFGISILDVIAFECGTPKIYSSSSENSRCLSPRHFSTISRPPDNLESAATARGIDLASSGRH